MVLPVPLVYHPAVTPNVYGVTVNVTANGSLQARQRVLPAHSPPARPPLKGPASMRPPSEIPRYMQPPRSRSPGVAKIRSTRSGWPAKKRARTPPALACVLSCCSRTSYPHLAHGEAVRHWEVFLSSTYQSCQKPIGAIRFWFIPITAMRLSLNHLI